MTNLLPCPFCGGEATLTEDYVLGPNEPLYAVMCQSLADWYETRFTKQHGGPPICGGTLGRAFSSRSDAIAAWNRRAPAIPPNVREAIRKIADYGMPLGATNYDWRGWRDTALTCLDAQEDRP